MSGDNLSVGIDLLEWLLSKPAPILVVLAEVALYLGLWHLLRPGGRLGSQWESRLKTEWVRPWLWLPLWMMDVLVAAFGQFHYFPYSGGAISFVLGLIVLGPLLAAPFVVAQVCISHYLSLWQKVFAVLVTASLAIAITVTFGPLWALTHMAP